MRLMGMYEVRRAACSACCERMRGTGLGLCRRATANHSLPGRGCAGRGWSSALPAGNTAIFAVGSRWSCFPMRGEMRRGGPSLEPLVLVMHGSMQHGAMQLGCRCQLNCLGHGAAPARPLASQAHAALWAHGPHAGKCATLQLPNFVAVRRNSGLNGRPGTPGCLLWSVHALAPQRRSCGWPARGRLPAWRPCHATAHAADECTVHACGSFSLSTTQRPGKPLKRFLLLIQSGNRCHSPGAAIQWLTFGSIPTSRT